MANVRVVNGYGEFLWEVGCGRRGSRKLRLDDGKLRASRIGVVMMIGVEGGGCEGVS